MRTVQPKTNIFVGAEEYFAYQGLKAGYDNIMTEEEVYEYLENRPLQKLEMTHKCSNCFLLGYFLGLEIRSSYEEERRLRESIKKLNKTQKEYQKARLDTTGARDFTNGVSGSRFTVG